ncbi:hypothetical protein AND_000355 [Anopheles darlingi]|uniref:Uncharacterized protein n=1 Tax=Anopheles darlingi TaxID=43151 RepID=W5JUI7_ANODA|nr:hypothetical protein AND_000355 [Anopheles darlingi]
MVHTMAATPSQSHGGALYYVVEVPREEYLKECAAQASALAYAGGYPNPAYQAQYHAHHQQFQQHMAAINSIHNHNNNNNNVTTTTTTTSSMLARLNSTESGWDNPFRPGGDLSREADEIVNLIKGGKPITPTGEQSLVNGGANATDGSSHIDAEANAPTAVLDGAVTKAEAAQLQSTQQNGTKSPHKGATGAGSPAAARNGATETTGAAAATTVVDGGSGPGGAIGQTPISNQVIPGPQSASHVVIDEKKKKKCTCCVIQ